MNWSQLFANKEGWIDLGVLLFCFAFLLYFFEPRQLFSLTITTGGDTGSHYYTGVYLKEFLLPQGRIMGWLPGNYAGFPLFYHYFPLPFVLIALLSFLIPMQIAFKLISVLGIFLLPVAAFSALRLLKYPFPIPSLGALFTLPFLFMEANSMWGANIPSTLAGEFSYGIGLSLLFIFFGTLYQGLEDKKWVLLNGLLVALLALSHGYAIITAGVFGSYFFWSRQNFKENFFYLFKVFGLGTLLCSFWLLPFISTLPYVTEYVEAWHIKSIFEVLPRILLPGAILSLGALLLNLFDRRTRYFLYCFVLCLLLYFLSPRIGVLDIRFIPILQIFLSFFGATLPLLFLKEVRNPKLLPAIFCLIIALWVGFNVSYIRGWIAWNYSGFDGKPTWPLLQQISKYLREAGPGRVVYEHSPLHNAFGTERVFESLPFFAGRETLEGLYMQSSISSPFVFYIQSEVSKVCSGPFPQYIYSHLNLASALPRLKLFNVRHYIARTPEAKKQAAATAGFRLAAQFGEYQIYELTDNDGSYVTPLRYEPVQLETRNWKRDFHEWFRRKELLDLHLVYDRQPAKELKFQTDNLLILPKREIKLPHPPAIREELKNEELSFTTNLVGYPHLVKISYHPNWQVEGADRVYLVSPSFMLVYPNQKNVRLYFGKTIFNYLGEGLTIAGLSIIIFSGIISLVNARKK